MFPLVLTANDVPPTFFYPSYKRFPFDKVFNQIVRELEGRNWEVPGLKITLGSNYNPWHGDVVYVEEIYGTIKGQTFRIKSNVNAVYNINIPGWEITVYSDNSGSLYKYVGNNWEEDMDRFMNGYKFHAKMEGLEMWYVGYTPIWSRLGDPDEPWKKHSPIPGKVADFMIPTKDPREYYPDENSGIPMKLVLSEVHEMFANWLKENLLVYIQEQPIVEVLKPFYTRLKRVSVPEWARNLYAFGNSEDVERILKSIEFIDALPPSQMYGLVGTYRLIPALVPYDENLPRIAYDDFVWCGIGEVSIQTRRYEVVFPGQTFEDKELGLIRVCLNDATQVYVADMASVRYNVGDQNSPEHYKEVASNLVPLTEYEGNYGQPVVLVRRKIALSEVTAVKVFA